MLQLSLLHCTYMKTFPGVAPCALNCWSQGGYCWTNSTDVWKSPILCGEPWSIGLGWGWRAGGACWTPAGLGESRPPAPHTRDLCCLHYHRHRHHHHHHHHNHNYYHIQSSYQTFQFQFYMITSPPAKPLSPPLASSSTSLSTSLYI